MFVDCYLHISDAPAPYYRWINSLCRIYFATKSDDSPVPQMERALMDAVMDSPSKSKSKKASSPLDLTGTELLKPEESKKAIQTMLTNIVQPSCKEQKKLSKTISTEEYITKLMTANRAWKPRQTKKVTVTKRLQVAPVTPFRKATSTSTQRKKDASGNEESQAATDTTQNPETEEQIEMDRNMAQQLQETYTNEATGIISMDPSFTPEDDMSTLPWEDSGLGDSQYEPDSQTLPDLPSDGTEEEDNLDEDPNDASYDYQMDTDIPDSEDEESEVDENMEEQAITITPISNSNDQQTTEETEETITPISNSNDEQRNQETPEASTSYFVGTENNPIVLPTQTIVPLHIDFLDQLGRLYDEKKTGLFESFANTKLFDGEGNPITTDSILSSKDELQNQKEVNKENAVYMDVITTDKGQEDTDQTFLKTVYSKNEDNKENEAKKENEPYNRNSNIIPSLPTAKQNANPIKRKATTNEDCDVKILKVVNQHQGQVLQRKKPSTLNNLTIDKIPRQFLRQHAHQIRQRLGMQPSLHDDYYKRVYKNTPEEDQKSKTVYPVANPSGIIDQQMVKSLTQPKPIGIHPSVVQQIKSNFPAHAKVTVTMKRNNNNISSFPENNTTSQEIPSESTSASAKNLNQNNVQQQPQSTLTPEQKEMEEVKKLIEDLQKRNKELEEHFKQKQEQTPKVGDTEVSSQTKKQNEAKKDDSDRNAQVYSLDDLDEELQDSDMNDDYDDCDQDTSVGNTFYS